MENSSTPAQPRLIALDEAAAGILAVPVDAREARTNDDKDARRTEVLLADVGLSVNVIATVTGKNADAVRKAIQRGRKK
jgi:DNA-directed RNA polymerase specialized sigma24 family protein